MVLRITIRPPGFDYSKIPEGGGVIDPDAPFNAIADEGDNEAAMVQQVADRRLQGALQKLNDMAEPSAPPQQQVAQGPAVDEGAAADEARTVAAERLGKSGAQPPASGPPPNLDVTRAAKDIGRGVVEAPRQVIGGARDAAQAAIDGLGKVGDWLNANVADLGTIRSLGADEQAQSIGQALTRLALEPSSKQTTMPKLPEVKAATTVTGGVVRGVSQFLAGFIGAGRVLGAASPGGVGGAMVKGALTDFSAFDAHEKRLSDLVQQVPALQNPITEFMSSHADETELTARFKRAVEGLGLGASLEGLLLALRALKTARAARAAAAEAAPVTPREAKPLTLLGDENGPALTKGDTPIGASPGVKATKDLGVPDEVAARALTAKGLTEPGAKFERGQGEKAFSPLFGEGKDTVYVNFARINSEGDVKRVIADTVEAFKGDIEAARRGVRSNLTTTLASGKEDAWQVLTARRKGEPLNAEQSVAVRRLWEASGAKLLEVAEAAAREPSVENLYEFRKMLAIHHEVQTNVIAARTETARALQSWAIPAGGRGGADRLRAIENVLATYGGPEAAAALAQRVAALRNAPNAAAALDAMAERGVFARTVDGVKELWVNALLSSPQTHVVNVMGNTLGVYQNMVERWAAARLSQAMGSGEIQIGEAAAMGWASGQALREAFELFGTALRTGESRFGVEATKVADVGFVKAISAEHQGLDPANWLGKAVDGLGTVVNLPVRFLNAEDDFFKAIGYRMEVNAQAFRQASKEKQDGLLGIGGGEMEFRKRVAELAANPPEHIKIGAIDAAAYQTFTSKPGAIVQSINALDRRLMAGEYMGSQLGSLGMRMMVPFRNTPANLLNYAFERSPLAPLMTRWREDIAAGGARADIAATRMAMGTATLLLFMDLALDGHITSGGPKGDENKGVRATMERTGWQPYSVKVGDRYFSYKRTDPLGISLTMAADIAEVIGNANIDEDKRQSILQVSAASAMAIANSMLDKTYLQSVAELMDAIKNPDKGGTFVKRRLAGFEPAIAGLARRQIDPYMRYGATLTDELRNKTPGLSDTLPLARDMWGRPRSYQSGLGVVYDAVSPIYSRKLDPQPIDKEALEQGWHLEMPAWTLTYGKGVTVSTRNFPEAYSRLLELRSQVKPSGMPGAREMRAADVIARTPNKDLSNAELLVKKYGDVPMLALLNQVITGAGATPRINDLAAQYAGAGDGRGGGKEDLVKRIVADYGRAARYQLLEEFEFVNGVVARKRAKRAGNR